jgi:hypothetical protein
MNLVNEIDRLAALCAEEKALRDEVQNEMREAAGTGPIQMAHDALVEACVAACRAVCAKMDEKCGKSCRTPSGRPSECNLEADHAGDCNA